jgi:hypothetical protein
MKKRQRMHIVDFTEAVGFVSEYLKMYASSWGQQRIIGGVASVAILGNMSDGNHENSGPRFWYCADTVSSDLFISGEWIDCEDGDSMQTPMGHKLVAPNQSAFLKTDILYPQTSEYLTHIKCPFPSDLELTATQVRPFVEEFRSRFAMNKPAQVYFSNAQPEMCISRFLEQMEEGEYIAYFFGFDQGNRENPLRTLLFGVRSDGSLKTDHHSIILERGRP